MLGFYSVQSIWQGDFEPADPLLLSELQTRAEAYLQPSG